MHIFPVQNCYLSHTKVIPEKSCTVYTGEQTLEFELVWGEIPLPPHCDLQTPNLSPHNHQAPIKWKKHLLICDFLKTSLVFSTLIS